jgi:hypothetical protein
VLMYQAADAYRFALLFQEKIEFALFTEADV